MPQVELRCIEVVKTATWKFLMQHLSNCIMNQRGDQHGVDFWDEEQQGRVSMMALDWMDCKWRYFVASAESLAEGEPYIHCHLRQVTLLGEDKDLELNQYN
jgi:hypothetical protein